MSRKNLEKLLGSYATDTLTEQERDELFAAALHDRELFNALANKHALKELLDDPRSRRNLLEALEKRASAPWLQKLRLWFQRPFSWALAGSLTVGVLALSFVIQQTSPLPKPEKAPAASPSAPLEAPTPSEPTPQSQSTDKYDIEAAAPSSKPDHSAGTPTHQARVPEEKAIVGTELEKNQRLPGAQALKSRRVATGAERPPRIRYAILRRRGGGDYIKVNAAADFQTGDAARIAVEPNEDGFFYLISIDPLGTREILFPKSKTEDSARVDKDTTYLLPPAGDVTFSEGVGERRFMLVFSQNPLPDIDEALKTIKTGGASSGVTLVELALKPHK